MDQKKNFNDTNWALIEDLTKELFPDEFDLISRTDLVKIEKKVFEGADLSYKDEGGDMHSYEFYVLIIQTAVSTLHLVLDYLFSNPYKSGRKNNGEKAKDLVSEILSDDETAKKLRAEMKDLLISRREDINMLLNVIEIKENQDKAASQESQE